MRVNESSGPAPAKKKDDEEQPTTRVKEGQTLKDVAKENNTSEEELRRLNPQVQDGDSLKAGQEIQLPPKHHARHASDADPVAGPQETAKAGPAATAQSPEMQDAIAHSDSRNAANEPPPLTAVPGSAPTPEVHSDP